MQIARDTVVDLHCRITGPDGGVILSGAEPISYLHGGYGDLFPKLEQALAGKGVGESVEVILEPKDAFGDYDADLVTYEHRHHFETPPQVGEMLEGIPRNGDQSVLYRVVEVDSEKVLLDANHPLAGIDLTAYVTIKDVRPATPQDIMAKKNALK